MNPINSQEDVDQPNKQTQPNTLPSTSSTPEKTEAALNPLLAASVAQGSAEERYLALIEQKDKAALDALSRNDLADLIKSARYYETALVALSQLKKAESPKEIEACMRLIEVERSPSMATIAFACASRLLGNKEKLAEIFPEFCGPKIYMHPGEFKIRGGNLVLHGEPYQYATNFGFGSRSYTTENYAVETLRHATLCLRGQKEAQVALARLAVNIKSEDKGLGSNRNLECEILGHAFPEQFEVTTEKVYTGRRQIPTKFKRYASTYRTVSHLELIDGQSIPTAPEGLDGREARIFNKMMKAYVK